MGKIIKLNLLALNIISLNKIGVEGVHPKSVVPGPGGDAPEGYANFITSTGDIFVAGDGSFYVKQ